MASESATIVVSRIRELFLDNIAEKLQKTYQICDDHVANITPIERREPLAGMGVVYQIISGYTEHVATLNRALMIIAEETKIPIEPIKEEFDFDRYKRDFEFDRQRF